METFNFKKIPCPKCGEPIVINIAKAIDELGEVFACKCGKRIRYVNK